MNKRDLLPVFLLALLPCVPAAAAPAATTASAVAGLHELDVSAGRWIYHGRSMGGAGVKPSAWTWHEDCRWSANRAFMLCSFSNTWGARHVNSVVIDTYDRHAHTFWHYEVFDSGSAAGKPFASRMRIDGPVRIESWTGKHHGKPIERRIVYRFASDRRVSVRFEESKDGTHWKTTASGTGVKLAAR